MAPYIVSHLAQWKEWIVRERLQTLVLLGLSVGIVTLTAITYVSDRLAFRRFFGSWNPVVAVVLIVLLGGALLSYLGSRGWFAIYQPGNPSRFLVPSGLAILLGAVMILVDRQGVFPKDINIRFPQSIAFYPIMGYVADIAFSILPLTLLLVLLTSLSEKASFSTVIWPCILIASVLEPIFQVGPNIGTYPRWASAYVALHIMAINVIQLALFKRHDFITMYAFRIAYYVVWHIVWGYARLNLLF